MISLAKSTKGSAISREGLVECPYCFSRIAEYFDVGSKS
jgi:hypothetical protein